MSYPRTSVYTWNNKHKFVKEKTKPASFNDFGVVVLAPNKIFGAFPWLVSVFSVLWNIMF